MIRFAREPRYETIFGAQLRVRVLYYLFSLLRQFSLTALWRLRPDTCLKSTNQVKLAYSMKTCWTKEDGWWTRERQSETSQLCSHGDVLSLSVTPRLEPTFKFVFANTVKITPSKNGWWNLRVQLMSGQ